MASKTCPSCGGSGYNAQRGVMPGSQKNAPLCPQCNGSGWIYKDDTTTKDGRSGGCFVTTATLKSIGKKDDCEELNSFRNFRDNWLLQQIDGKKLISEYYDIAPEIVKSINSLQQKEIIYNKIWLDELKPCLDLIKNKQFCEAKEHYKIAMLKLKREFLNR